MLSSKRKLLRICSHFPSKVPSPVFLGTLPGQKKGVYDKMKSIFQFKIVLEDIRPQVWRRIQVPGNYSFHKLHSAIQDAMGWWECHLYQFEIVHPDYDELDVISDGYENQDLDGKKMFIKRYFSLSNPRATYLYDFGDNWMHSLTLEKIITSEKSVTYPRCLAGKRACPPEDCGGTFGYEELLRKLKNPKHPEHQECIDWLGGTFDPSSFDPKKVVFRKV